MNFFRKQSMAKVVEKKEDAPDVASEALLHPDFYDYDWLPPVRVWIDGEFGVMAWPDGVELRAHGWWLRENLVEEGTVDAVTREGTLDPADFSPKLQLADIQVTEGGAVLCRWGPEPKEGRLHPGWLRHVAEGRHGIRAGFPKPHVWEAADMTEVPSEAADEVLESDSALRDWLRTLLRFGVARLTGLSPETGALEELVHRIGPVRESNFGAFWSVRFEPSPTSTAYGCGRLAPHTDLPTRETPPGFQWFHCLENHCEGGTSLMADGQAIVRYLAENEAHVYEALTELNWIFFNRSPDHDHRWSGPIIDPGHGQSPMTIRSFYPLRAFPDMEEKDIPRAYRAVRRFHQLTADARFEIRYEMAKGDVIVMDNRRILHGREAFSEDGKRHFRGCYLDLDEIHSCLRVLDRRLEERSRKLPD